MRCPDCNKFVSYDEPDPESKGLEVSFEIGDDGALYVDLADEIMVCLACSECGTELKQAVFEFEHNARIERPIHLRGVLAEYLEVEAAWESLSFSSKHEGGGRRKKAFYGYEGTVEVKYCRKGASSKIVHTLPASDHEQASSFEELV